MLLLSRMILLQYTQLRLIGPNVSNIFRACSTKSAANTSTGIEHALRFKNELGQANRKDFVKDYKCIEYLNFNNYTFYDKECELQSMRVPQPSKDRPDIEPKITITTTETK